MRARLLALCATFSVAGCSDSRDCTEMAATSQIVLDLPSGWTVDEFCLGETCAATLNGPLAQVPVLDEPAEYEYRYTVTAPDGQRYGGEGRVTTEEYRINGEGCPPLTANAAIVVAETGEPTIVHPSD